MVNLLIEVNELARRKSSSRQGPPRAQDYEVRIRGKEGHAFDQRGAEELKEKINAIMPDNEPFTIESTKQKIPRFKSVAELKKIAVFSVHRNPTVETRGSLKVSEDISDKIRQKFKESPDSVARLDEFAVIRSFSRDPGAARKMAKMLKGMLEKQGHSVETLGVGRPGDG